MNSLFAKLVAAGILAATIITPAHALNEEDRSRLSSLTEKWVEGWRTSPDQPFKIDQISDLYAKTNRLFSYDFGRPHDGVEGWEEASRYYAGFMAIPARWKLTPGQDLRVKINGDVGWTTLSLKGEGAMPNGDPISLPEARVTLIFERQPDGGWLIVHEHGSASIPFPDKETTRRLLAPRK